VNYGNVIMADSPVCPATSSPADGAVSLPHDLPLDFDARTTSLPSSPASTDCVHPSVSMRFQLAMLLFYKIALCNFSGDL